MAQVLSRSISTQLITYYVPVANEGCFGQVSADKLGDIGPFQLAIALTVLALFFVWQWPENHGGDGSDNEKQHLFGDAIQCIQKDRRILLLGMNQSLFEGAMYTFVYHVGADSRTHGPWGQARCAGLQGIWPRPRLDLCRHDGLHHYRRRALCRHAQGVDCVARLRRHLLHRRRSNARPDIFQQFLVLSRHCFIPTSLRVLERPCAESDAAAEPFPYQGSCSALSSWWRCVLAQLSAQCRRCAPSFCQMRCKRQS